MRRSLIEWLAKLLGVPVYFEPYFTAIYFPAVAADEAARIPVDTEKPRIH